MSSLPISLENNNLDLRGEKLSIIEIQKDSLFQTEVLAGGVEIIEKISAEWIALCEEGASNVPFFRPEWFTCFVKNFEMEILILTVRRAGKLRAVLPLMKESPRRGAPIRKLQAVYNLNTQRFGLIHGADETERKEIIEAIWKEIKSQSKWHILEMRLVVKDSWLNDLLVLAERENYKTGIWQMDSAPFVTLPQGADKETLFEAYNKSLKSSFRLDLKRRLTRLKEQGKVDFVVTRGYQEELMQKYFELEAHSWKGRAGTAVTDDPNVIKLHDDFARAVAANNALFIYELKLDGKTIAMILSIMCGSKTFFWKTSYNEDYGRFSPGRLLLKEVLADCIRNDSNEFDMLCPASSYKKVWASGEREHAAFYIFRRGLIGSLLWRWKFTVISYLRKFKNKKAENANTANAAK